jgi:WD40 repeat protein
VPPTFAKCTLPIPAGDDLALVSLGNTSGIAVRDIAEISNAATVCSADGGTLFRFVDASHISYIVTGSNGQGALYLFDLQNNTTSLVRAWSAQAFINEVYAWSPDGKILTYLSSDPGGVTWHVRSAAGDVVLSRLGAILSRTVDPNNDDAMVGFSADGLYVSLEETFGSQGSAPFQVIHLADHQLAYSRSNGTMATWSRSGARLFYRTTSGVEAWDPTNGAQLFVPGLSWIHPWPSADGLRIAYTTVNASGNHFPGYIRLDDQPVAGIQLSKLPRAGAVFLTSTIVWYAQESICGVTALCGPSGPKLTGLAYLNNLVIGTEKATIETAFFDSWPHYSGQ